MKLVPSEYHVVLEPNMPEPQLWLVVEIDKSGNLSNRPGWLGALVWARRGVRGIDPRDVASTKELLGPVTGSIASGKLDPFNPPPEIEAKLTSPGEIREIIVRAPDGAMEVKRGVLVYDYLDLVEGS
jgi:hypothetical protein